MFDPRSAVIYNSFRSSCGSRVDARRKVV